MGTVICRAPLRLYTNLSIMKFLILLSVAAFCAARPQFVFLIPNADGQGGLQQLDAAQVAALQQNLQPFFNNLQAQTAPVAPAPAPAPAPEAAPAPTPVEAAPAEPAAPVEAAPVEAAPAEAAPAVPVADPALNQVDQQFQSFIFPDDEPAVVAAKQAHFQAVMKALGSPQAGEAAPAEAAPVEAAPAEAAPAEAEQEPVEAEAAEAEAAEMEAAEAEAGEAGEAGEAAEAEAGEAGEAGEGAEAEAGEAGEAGEAEAEAA